MKPVESKEKEENEDAFYDAIFEILSPWPFTVEELVSSLVTQCPDHIHNNEIL